ncbi:MAG: NADH-quinone oxidoreductase subunit B family protein [Candidatus Omnitrophota bacterium]
MAVNEKIPGADLVRRFPGGQFVLTTTESLFKWSKASSLWPMTFGLACCAIEIIATGAARFDIDRFGAGVFRASPRQCDVMIVAGTVCVKMGQCIKRLYEQMPEPKYVIAMGNCAVSGGIFYHDTYSVVKGVEALGIPVDVFIPGCPPRPENVLAGLMKLQQKIIREVSCSPSK